MAIFSKTRIVKINSILRAVNTLLFLAIVILIILALPSFLG